VSIKQQEAKLSLV